MKKYSVSLLPKGTVYRDALINSILKIKPRLPLSASKRIWRLKKILFKLPVIGLIVITLMGYYPVLSFPPLKQSIAKADESIKQEIVADSLPSPINLPHPGYLSSRFSTWHPGVDIATGLGMPIHPITQGVVEDVTYELWGLGHHVTISHPGGYKSTYGHMGRVYAKVGQQVDYSSTLGEVGMTGSTSGPHTHLETTKDGKYIDPQSILPKLEDFPKPEYLRPVGGGVKTELTKTLKPDFK